uniref:Adenylyl-sulfate kinase n=1 Tax=Coralloluteibacterium stylophorae TaxID=1776034 RepID=A0A8J8B115_9GAMM
MDAPDQLRVIACGSVDDGKSSLLGRLLFESGNVPDDQLETLARVSARHGTTGGVDYALLLDGLEAEREQGITIDVAWRYFRTPRRRFILGDCPGHEQYTRNMATAASTADAAIVLVDARKGLLPQTHRHARICAMFGVRRVLLAVNKIDLVTDARGTFEAIAAAFDALAAGLGFDAVTAVPLSALRGDNLTARAAATPWYPGPTLLEWLEACPVPPPRQGALRLPVQWINRPDAGFRGIVGTIAAGTLRQGEELVVFPSGARSRVARLLRGFDEAQAAGVGEAVTVVLADEIDVARGDVLAAAATPPQAADQFAAHLLWMDASDLLPGRSYLMQIGTALVPAQVTALRHRVDIESGQPLSARRLGMNELGFCHLALEAPVAFEPYAQAPALGGFTLIDRRSNATAGVGTIDHALHRAANLHWQALEVDKAARATAKGQAPACLWFTGLSGSGKSTIADSVERQLHARGYHTYLLDGDNVRHGLNRDLGFTDADRVENVRRVAEVARLMVDAGLIVLVSFISPFASERRSARTLFAPGEFLEVFVDTPLELCEARAPKGLYAKARAGGIPNFTGIDSPYERPEQAELVLDTRRADPDALARQVIAHLLGEDAAPR